MTDSKLKENQQLDSKIDADYISFAELLTKWRSEESVGTDDVLSMCLPLLEQVVDIHDKGLVAPLNGIDFLNVSLGHLWFANSNALESQTNITGIKKLQKSSSLSQLDITAQYRETENEKWPVAQYENELIAKRTEEQPRQAYYPDYISWEENAYHHDALSDVYVLGLILGSLASRLDLSDDEELKIFVDARTNLTKLNPRLHPVVAQLIEKMTELDRHKRPQDLRTVIQALKHYRDQEIEDSGDAHIVLSEKDDRKQQRKFIQQHLRNKLFEVSRRNRLLYFRETGLSANLTVGSVPHVLEYSSIRPEQLLFTNQEFCKQLGKDKPISMSRWLKFEDYPFLPSSLDKIRLQAQRDIKEYGFSQLRIVLAFLRWHNLKDAPEERIHSPLILVPATLKKKKGVKDSFILESHADQAEINPALRHHLQQLYNIKLPERIDAGNIDAIRELHTDLERQLQVSAKGVELALVETPRIQLIHRSARRKLDDFRRRQRKTGRGFKDYSGLNYSYSRNNYEPLGVQVFDRDIRTANAPSREMLEDETHPRIFEHMTEVNEPSDGNSKQIQKSFYAIDQGSSGGPNDWEVDLCSVTLANFNYRKMTLVQDYSELIESDSSNTQDNQNINFDTLFSDQAKQQFQPLESIDHAENFLVLPADPSQQEAVLRASTSQSYVIQGPPGTGKSQTITNLIADYVAREKAVLFVCEKRAALDVVFHRLKQVGLGDACTIIHDSQEDKKAFIHELKGIYESWLHDGPDNQLCITRENLIEKLRTHLDELKKFSDVMQSPPQGNSQSLRELIEHWISAGAHHIDISSQQRAQLPSWTEFHSLHDKLQQIRDALKSAGYEGILARSPVRYLKGDLATDTNLVGHLEQAIPRALTALGEAKKVEQGVISLLKLDSWILSELEEVTTYCRSIMGLALAEKLQLLDADATQSIRLSKALDKLHEIESRSTKLNEKASGWLNEPQADVVDESLEIAKKYEGRFFAFLSGAWRSVKRLIANDFEGQSKGAVDTLKKLHKAHLARQEVNKQKLKIEDNFGLQELDELRPHLYRAWHDRSELSAIQRDVIDQCITENENTSLNDISREVLLLARNHSSLNRVEEELSDIFTSYKNASLEQLIQVLEALSENIDQSYEFVDLLADLDQAGDNLSSSLRSINLPLEQLEVAILDETIQRSLKRNNALRRFDSERLTTLVGEINQSLDQLRDINGRFALNVCQTGFHNNLARVNQSAAGTSQEEKDWRRDYNRGRKILEREFEKTRAYKSIRELFAADSGEVLRNIKPVWLMSPLSVADVLPLNENLFDVVIFDEASQIPLEDAIPSLYRSKQTIVVGDEMQLPPTIFFNSQKNDDEAEELAELYLHDLNADSFLNRASGALPTTMLSWHYRSRHESLIGFCNQAFYTGNLQTIPSVADLHPQASIRIQSNNEIANNIETIFNRPISYHQLENSPYESQRNPGEAKYIAQLIREILNRESAMSIGVVAFSQAQQDEIERAIAVLAQQDKQFQTKLDLEEEREEDGQFVGLFVKNLENVQGDERDIIILSVCYGPGPSGKMIMNFGPINQNGGEKRLNVIFSRAKQHMVVVTSIEDTQITNTYNDGANALRQYLRYARAVSEGDSKGMQAALVEYGYYEKGKGKTLPGQAIIDQLESSLRAHHLVVEKNYGQSDLRCHLAVREQGDQNYRLAIMIDDNEHYAIEDITTRYTTHPGILSAFGWQVITVLAKDWHRDPDVVIERIIKSLAETATVQ